MWLRLVLFLLVGSFVVVGANYTLNNSRETFKPRINLEKSDYWKVYDSLMKISQPNSARIQLRAILESGIENDNHYDISRAVNSFVQTISPLEPDERKSLFIELNSTVQTLSEPSKTLSKTFLVNQIMNMQYYWLPYGVNVDKVRFGDDTLSLSDPYDKAKFVFKRTEEISDDLKQLQNHKLDVYWDFLQLDKDHEKLLPTVFDYVAVNLIQFYQNYDFKRYHEWKNVGESNETWFYTPDKFSKVNFDEESLRHKVLNVYKNLEGFHLKDSQLLSSIYYQRLKYIFNEVNEEETKPIWKSAFDYFKDQSSRSKFLYELALLKYQSRKSYDFKTNTSVEGDLVEAKKMLKDELDKFPENDFAEQISNLIELIEQPRVDFQAQSTAYPGDKIPLKLEHQNSDSIIMFIFKSPEDHPKNLGLRELLNDDYYKQIRKLNLSVKDLKDHQKRATEYLLEEIEEGGDYLIIATNTEEDFNKALKSDSLWRISPKAQHTLLVSEIMVTTEKNDGGMQFYVTNYKTGKPIEGAKVSVYFNRNFQILSETPNRIGKTDELGRYFAKVDQENIYYTVNYKESEVSSSDYIYNYAYDEPNYKVKILTDRAIYRPGQTVHYKIIAYKGDDNNFQVASNESIKLVINDNSWTQILEKSLQTNDYGSVSGSYTLPLGGPLGRFTMNVAFNLHSGNAASSSHNFRVEEYKRPTFEAKIDPPKSEAKLNDSVSVTGSAKAFAGFPITDAKVNYKIYRNWNTYWRYFGNNSQGRDLLVDSVLTTDENGEFKIDFFAETDPNAPENANYTFEIIADVVEVSGETHAANKSLNLSKTGLTLRYTGPQELRTDKEDFAVYKVMNMSGEPQSGFKGKVEIYKVEQSKRFLSRIWSHAQYQKFEEEEWKKLFPYAILNPGTDQLSTEVLQKTIDFKVDDSLKLKDFLGDKQGTYRLNAYTITEKGDTIKNSQTLKIIDIESKEVPEKTELWSYQSRQTIEVGETVDFQVGSTFKNANAFVQLRRGTEVIKEEWMDISNRQSLSYIAKEQDRGGISYHVSMVYDGKHYSKSLYVNVPRTNKMLTIKAETFRDQLLPGQEEEWRFTISGEGADQLAAEVCAGMYDASLDQFVGNYWSLWPYRGNYYYPSWRSANSRSTNLSSGQGKWQDQSYLINNQYGNQNMDIFRALGGGYNRGREMVMFASRSTRRMDMDESVEMEEVQIKAQSVGMNSNERSKKLEDVPTEQLAQVSQKDISDNRNSQTKTPQIRENFNETAFFYPDLKTNEKNEFVVSFTLPESLTEWKFMALAHTKDLKTGSLELRTIAQKPLMITSNAPRFFRSGDQFDFASKVVNLTEEEQTVDVNLSFFKPTNDEVVNLIGRQPQSKQMTIPAGASKEVVWNLDLTNQEGLIAYKITAANEEFSDGEQKPVPVLSNRQYVTEAMPFVVTKKGVSNFSFDKLKNTTSSSLKHERVTFEYTVNPAWNAVLALPYLAEYPYECAEQLFSRYYANKLASDVIDKKPKIKAMFEEWRNYSPEVFMSALNKNEELKSILLEETPWILDAKDESERKRRVAELFEVNQLARSQEKALHLLSKKQNSDGGFGWFGGNRSNIYITQHIVAGFGHLEKLGIEVPQKAKTMIDEALSYMDSYHLHQYNKLTEKQKKEVGVSSITLHWLYASSYFSNKPSQSVQKVKDHYHKKLQSNWSNFGLQQQAMAGLYFKRVNDEKHTQMILSSLRDRSKNISDKGMYFPENNGGYYWNQAKIETQAMIIEFFVDAEAKTAEIDALRLWLILQKRSNSWENTKATAMATYALLLNGTDYFADGEDPVIKVGKERIVFSKNVQENERYVKVTPGLGHFKTTWSGGEVYTDLGNIEIEKSTSTPSYGALYWGYFEDMSKVEASTNADISIKKTFRKVKAGSKGDEYVASNTFKVGDRVNIELVVTVAQDMEYVHIKDLRPAGFEPKMAVSQHQWKNGLWYYQSPRDVSMNYFVDRLPKGTHVLNYEVFVTSSGQLEAGNATVQCMYAPEFVAHSGGGKVKIIRN